MVRVAALNYNTILMLPRSSAENPEHASATKTTDDAPVRPGRHNVVLLGKLIAPRSNTSYGTVLLFPAMNILAARPSPESQLRAVNASSQ